MLASTHVAAALSCAGSGQGSLQRLQFHVPTQVAPVMLGFKVKLEGDPEQADPQYVGPRHGSHFTVPVGVGTGSASKLGEPQHFLSVY